MPPPLKHILNQANRNRNLLMLLECEQFVAELPVLFRKRKLP
jgi:hypothetical protein